MKLVMRDRSSNELQAFEGAAVAKAAVLQDSQRIHRWSVHSPPPSPRGYESPTLLCCLKRKL